MSYQATLNAELDKMRANGLSIDGDNAYKRDLLYAVTGALAYGKQRRTPPPAGHWLEPFYEMGMAEADERDAARSLPVGVPDGETWQTVALLAHELADMVIKGDAPEHCARTARILMNEFHRAPSAPTVKAEQAPADRAALVAELRKAAGEIATAGHFGWGNAMTAAADALAAPSLPVKAEQVQCGMREALQNMLAAFDNPIARQKLGGEFAQEAIASAKAALQAPSLPAAGSALEEVEVVAWRVSHPDTAWRVYERNPESWAAGDYEIQDLMTVAQHKRIVAALSAQQSAPDWIDPVALSSCGPVYDAGWRDGVAEAKRLNERVVPTSAPERVSVPVELAERLAVPVPNGKGWTTWNAAVAYEAAKELRALLASHGRGEV